MKTLRDYSGTTTKEQSLQSSILLRSWGTIQNGKLLTASIMSHKTGNEFTLSDILETNPSKKYSLSTKSVQSMMKHSQRHKEQGNGFGVHIVEQLMPTIQKVEDQEL